MGWLGRADVSASGRKISSCPSNAILVSLVGHGTEVFTPMHVQYSFISPPFPASTLTHGLMLALIFRWIEVGEETLTKKPSILEEIAYRDTWGRGADLFISMIYERLKIMHDLLGFFKLQRQDSMGRLRISECQET